MIVSVHVRKCAGSSFRKALQEYYKNSIRLDYGDQIGSSDPQSIAIRKRTHRQVEDHKVEIAKRFRIVHGHFYAKKYECVPTVKRYATILRDPVARLLSNYFYLKRNPERTNPDANIVHQHGATLEDYINFPDAQNVQAQFLDGVPLTSFDFVGITEDYANSIRLFNRLFRAQLQASHSENTNPKGENQYDVSPEIVSLIKKRNEQDVELYEKAKEFFRADCRRYLPD
ncbi:sulfotransferase family 2 domain-containing protein [Kordiimonas sp.]|uniref:sulfotransferase family 2 domain-containing protein n=1 Tax=Kordiimonas sp. TaxID=1970157 RepID=UPI003A942CDD